MFHDSQIGYQCRESVVCDFGFYIRDRLYDGGLSSIWETYESDISDELQFHLHFDFITDISDFSKIRSLTSTRREVCISESPPSTMTECMLLTWSREIDDDSTSLHISHDRPYWHFEDGIFSGCSVHLLCRATFAFMGLDDFCMAITYEGRLMGRSSEYDIPTISPITTEWPSIWNILFSSP